MSFSSAPQKGGKEETAWVSGSLRGGRGAVKYRGHPHRADRRGTGLGQQLETRSGTAAHLGQCGMVPFQQRPGLLTVFSTVTCNQVFQMSLNNS